MKSGRLIPLLSLFCFLASSAAVAADNWKLPNLNPFKKASASRSRASISDQPKKKTSLPKLALPTLPGLNAKSDRGPSTWDKMTHGTRKIMHKTKQLLWPWGKASQSRASSGDKSSFFGSWFGKQEPEPERPRSVSDFLARDRVPY